MVQSVEHETMQVILQCAHPLMRAALPWLTARVAGWGPQRSRSPAAVQVRTQRQPLSAAHQKPPEGAKHLEQLQQPPPMYKPVQGQRKHQVCTRLWSLGTTVSYLGFALACRAHEERGIGVPWRYTSDSKTSASFWAWFRCVLTLLRKVPQCLIVL
jgi:hypothetical protein